MSKWVEINGAKIQKDFLEANIHEARNYDWSEICPVDLTEHVHCMICGVTIDPKYATKQCAFKSRGGYVCGYCYKHFLT
jgi:hypothetical protein